ncbi:MAG: hypothetical protein DRP85_03105 [Candidatus Makaraimicrobium thalassicum]|nr:MAG: hypothetical protein DRP85_03105 [Candidatus Omnitrophota bacterium]
MLTKILKTLIGILLIPVAVGTAQAFCANVSSMSVDRGVLHVFERGVLVYVLFHVLVLRPVYIYVIGHEFVHVLATWLCGGKVVSFNVSPSSGNVLTSKTNFFIELSPYFVPIYTILLGPVFLLLEAVGKGAAFMSTAFVFLMGVTLAFHFVMTAEALKLRQSDVRKSGLVFSLIIVFVGNLVIVMLVFCPVFKQLSFVDFIKSSVSNSGEVYRVTFEKILKFLDSPRTLIG